MTNWIVSLRCLIPLRELTLGFLLLLLHNNALAQQFNESTSTYLEESLYDTSPAFQSMQTDTVPEPTNVMLRSAIIPGWGQLTNKQIWKIPIVYGALAGITYYSISLHSQYTDYKAAYYNTHSDDEKFGQTPEYIDPNRSAESLRTQRDFLRNRRDFAFIGIFLAYGLNIVDAYVYAQFRDFDVSDDLSARVGIKPDWISSQKPVVSLSIRLTFK